jgi:hypothetical protein
VTGANTARLYYMVNTGSVWTEVTRVGDGVINVTGCADSSTQIAVVTQDDGSYISEPSELASVSLATQASAANGSYTFLEAVRACAETTVKQFNKVRLTSGPQETYDEADTPLCEIEFGDIEETDEASDDGIVQVVNGTVRVIVASGGGDERKAIETALSYINRVKNAVGANTTFVAYLGRMGRVTATEAEDPFEAFEFPITGKIVTTATGR